MANSYDSTMYLDDPVPDGIYWVNHFTNSGDNGRRRITVVDSMVVVNKHSFSQYSFFKVNRLL